MSGWTLITINNEMIDAWYSRADCLVYSRLRWFCYKNPEHRISISEQTIAEDCRLSRKQVSNSLKTLEQYSLVSINRRWIKKRNNYAVIDLDIFPCAVDY